MFQRLSGCVLLCLWLVIFSVPVQAQEAPPPKIKAIAFDAFPIFDPRAIAKASEEAFPGQGEKLMAIWRTKMFEYQWLRALGDQYEDFMVTTEAGLIFATQQLNLELTEDKKKRLLSEFMHLNMWPDAPYSIRELNQMGIKLVFLSNMTEAMLRNGLQQAGLEKEFQAILSTDLVRSYKPDPKAYALAVDKLGIPKAEILFVAFAGWDVAGAKWYGYPTFWVNRLNVSGEELGAQPDGMSRNLSGLVEYVSKYNQGIPTH